MDQIINAMTGEGQIIYQDALEYIGPTYATVETICGVLNDGEGYLSLGCLDSCVQPHHKTLIQFGRLGMQTKKDCLARNSPWLEC